MRWNTDVFSIQPPQETCRWRCLSCRILLCCVLCCHSGMMSCAMGHGHFSLWSSEIPSRWRVFLCCRVLFCFAFAFEQAMQVGRFRFAVLLVSLTKHDVDTVLLYSKPRAYHWQGGIVMRLLVLEACGSSCKCNMLICCCYLGPQQYPPCLHSMQGTSGKGQG